jgi:hypothetical protein
VGVGVRAVAGLEGGGHFFAEVEVFPAAHHEEVLGVLFNALALVGHE